MTYGGNITSGTQFLVDIGATTGISSGALTFSGTLGGAATSAGLGIRVQNSTSSPTITFSGTQNLGTSLSKMTNQAVTLTSNGSAAITFSGTLSIFTSGTAEAMKITNSGTVNVTGANNTISTADTATTCASGNCNIVGPVATPGFGPFLGTSVNGTITLKSMNMSIGTTTNSGMWMDNDNGGTSLTVNVTGCVFSGSAVTNNPNQSEGLLQLQSGGGTSAAQTPNLNVQNCFFQGSGTYGVRFAPQNNATGSVTINQCGFGTDVNSGVAVNNPGTAVTNPPPFDVGITNGGAAQVSYNITNNTFWGSDASHGAFYAVTFSGGAVTGGGFLSGSFNFNNIGKAGVTGSGCANHCAGIGLLPGNAGTFNATI